MESGRQVRLTAILLGVVMAVAMAGGAPSGGSPSGGGGSRGGGGQSGGGDQSAVSAAGEGVRAGFVFCCIRQGVGALVVAKEVGRMGLNFISGRPYLAAYEVAKDVPGMGRAVNEVIGEANLWKKAAHEQEDKGLFHGCANRVLKYSSKLI